MVIRGAFDADTAAACRAVIWGSTSGQGVREDDPATWPPLVELDPLAGEPFTAAGTCPSLPTPASGARRRYACRSHTPPARPDPSPVARAIVAGLARAD